MRTLLLDEAVVLVGVGLILLRRWAALLASVMAVYLAIYSARGGGGVGAVLTLSLLTPLLLTLLFWRDLVWGARWGDLLLILATLILNGMIVYAAFLIRHA